MAESDLCHFFIAATFHSLFLSFCVSVFARVWVFLHLRLQNKDFCNVGFKLSVCITVVSLTGLGPCTRAAHAVRGLYGRYTYFRRRHHPLAQTQRVSAAGVV